MIPPQIPGRVTGLFIIALAFSLPSSGAAQSRTSTRAGVAVSRQVDSVERTLVATLAAINRDGIAQARIAAPLITDTGIRRFAQRLADNYQVNLTATTVIAARLGHPPLATTPTVPVQPIVTDTAFLDAVIAWHQKLLEQLPASGVMLKDEELRLHLVETRQTALTHLGEAMRLKGRTVEGTP